MYVCMYACTYVRTYVFTVPLRGNVALARNSFARLSTLDALLSTSTRTILRESRPTSRTPLACSQLFCLTLDTRCSSLDKYSHKFHESRGQSRALDWLNWITQGCVNFVIRVMNSSTLLQLDHSLELV